MREVKEDGRVLRPWIVNGEVREVKEAGGKPHQLYCADIVLREGDPKGWRGYIASVQSADHISNGFTREEAEAHAHLIAAAPALLEALEFIRDGYDNQDVNHVDFRVKAYEVALDAIECALSASKVQR